MGGAEGYLDTLSTEVDWYFVEDAYGVGVLRHKESLKARRKESFSGKSKGVQAHKDGAVGEAGFCRIMGFTWPRSISTFKLADVGDYEVKSTPVLGGMLMIGVDDPLERRFVLMIIDLPRLHLVGWLPGDRVKRFPIEDVGKRKAPCYVITQDWLLSPWLLKWEIEDAQRQTKLRFGVQEHQP